MNKEYIRNILFTKSGNINSNLIRHGKVNDIKDFIVSFYGDTDHSLSYLITMYINDIIELPKCIECGCVLTEKCVRKKNPLQLAKFCSSKCSANNRQTKAKRKKTTIDKYGVDHYSKTDTFKKIISDIPKEVKSDAMKNYYGGIDFAHEMHNRNTARHKTISGIPDFYKNRSNALSSRDDYEEIIKKRTDAARKTIISRYGGYGHLNNISGRDNPTYNHLSEIQKDILTDKDKFKHYLDASDGCIWIMADNLNIAESTLYKKANLFNIDCVNNKTTKPHQIIIDLLDELNIEYLVNDRKTIQPYELDILIPSHNIAIEINGVYWHSTKYKEPTYHLMKHNMCVSNDIRLIQLFDIDIIEKRVLITSFIRNLLCKNTNSIYARKTTIHRIDLNTYKEFCNNNHIQGYQYANITYGVYYNDELISVIGISKPRFNKHYEYEIIRYCTKLNYNVVGGFGKMFKRFVVDFKPNSVITYSNKMLFGGISYLKNGFKYLYDSDIGYKYFVGGSLENRVKYQKHKLCNILNDFDPNLTEEKNMTNNNFYRVYDCGNIVFGWNK